MEAVGTVEGRRVGTGGTPGEIELPEDGLGIRPVGEAGGIGKSQDAVWMTEATNSLPVAGSIAIPAGEWIPEGVALPDPAPMKVVLPSTLSAAGKFGNWALGGRGGESEGRGGGKRAAVSSSPRIVGERSRGWQVRSFVRLARRSHGGTKEGRWGALPERRPTRESPAGSPALHAQPLGGGGVAKVSSMTISIVFCPGLRRAVNRHAVVPVALRKAPLPTRNFTLATPLESLAVPRRARAARGVVFGTLPVTSGVAAVKSPGKRRAR